MFDSIYMYHNWQKLCLWLLFELFIFSLNCIKDFLCSCLITSDTLNVQILQEWPTNIYFRWYLEDWAWIPGVPLIVNTTEESNSLRCSLLTASNKHLLSHDNYNAIAVNTKHAAIQEKWITCWDSQMGSLVDASTFSFDKKQTLIFNLRLSFVWKQNTSHLESIYLYDRYVILSSQFRLIIYNFQY